ncbi:hypothetical protein QYE76_026956 [Lolium multiflorum]|uniref:Transposase (putative) gypsy type domain-containing protein n=1 Tax=Lolium multiflorum TaxID=4521 RepID=A0AAD8Q5W2_LOLMU|nr:hypothetical protein QYE76_026956 [Lolium multiflorum]
MVALYHQRGRAPQLRGGGLSTTRILENGSGCPDPSARSRRMGAGQGVGRAWVFLAAKLFFSEILKAYNLQPHNISPNSVLAIANHVALCEGHLGGRDDTMRASKDNLSSDALNKRLRVMIKIPCGVHSHACNFDIHTGGAGIALETLEEKDLGNLTQVPQSGNTNPEAASNMEAPEGPAPGKRKRGAASGPASKRVCETPSAATTKKAEKEKQRIKEIDTSKSS